VGSFIVLLGAPGAGKGTQAKRVSQRLGLPHVSSGDLFREHARRSTDLGREAQRYTSRGELVPDNVTIAMIRERLSQPDCRVGALLDGFPRTAPQAEALTGLLQEIGAQVQDAVLIAASEDQLVERLAGRRVCEAQGHVYHLSYHPPRQPGVCDQDGSPLLQREDDRPDTVRNRIRVYEQQTRPVVDYYRDRGLLREIEGDRSIEEVTVDILKLLEPKVAG
jgi:adenylate kinase